jgi:hypothetical protein
MGSNQHYRKYLKPKCEACGFKPVHIRQLDIHHDDWDRDNNDPENLRTYCANCHRLVHIPPEEIESDEEWVSWMKRLMVAQSKLRSIREAFDPCI